MKKQSNLSRLLDYAGTYRILSYLSWVLAAAGALLALVPFWYIWRILREVIEVAPNYENAVHVTHYGWMATIAGLLTLLLIFDWRLGLLSLVPVALAFAVMTSMTGKEMQDKMTQYQNALADMSNEAVEYVRGIPVVKTFGQTVFSFKKFKGTIDNYELGHCLHQAAALAHDILHAGHQQRVRVPDRRRFPVFSRRNRRWCAAEPALLHHYHAGHLRDNDQADVYERERHDRTGCHHPH